ncbi:MAG: DUF2891 domain-containing protein [Flavobacteriaceae bacterium]|nr:DUF2891 domain-containing protein [Flavobacteriaceae bacterium]
MKIFLFGLLLLAQGLIHAQNIILQVDQAKKIIELPLQCIEQEYPNKTGQVLSQASDLGTPSDLHPVFYGCFDWHSAVHGYWTIVEILKRFPDLDLDGKIKHRLIQNFSSEKIAGEIAYFNRPHEYSYERTYGWAWLLKLQESLDTWNTAEGRILAAQLQPLTELLVERYIAYLPKLLYPIREGMHINTAFGLSFAYDYAVHVNHLEFKNLIEQRAKDYFLKDTNCPRKWEPGGYDFFSPCLQEADIMRKVLPQDAFMTWIKLFLPELTSSEFEWEVALVSDRSDGHLVHLDGLNFSRAWVLYGLASQFKDMQHLVGIADRHFNQAFPQISGDTYEGGHWLGSFALYALQQRAFLP